MRYLNKAAVRFIAVHCSATPPDMDIGADEIRRLHVSPPTVLVPWAGKMLPGRGWSDIGYHYVIRRDGMIEHGRSLDYQGAHVLGHNHESVGVCLIGGVKNDGTPDANYTALQYRSLEVLINLLLPRYLGAVVRGHRDFPGVTKACPSFDAPAWWSQHDEVA